MSRGHRARGRWARRIRMIGIAILLAAAPVAHVAEAADPYQGNPIISSGSLRLDVTGSRAGQLAEGWSYEEVTGPRQDFDPYRLVKFGGPLGSEHRRALEAAGFEVVAYYPYNAFLVRPDYGGSLDALDGISGVMWEGSMEPLLKLSPELFEAAQRGSVDGVAGDEFWGLRLVVSLHESGVVARTAAERRTVERTLRALKGVNSLLPTRGPIRIQVDSDPAVFSELLKSIVGMPHVSGVGVWRQRFVINDENVQVSQSGACVDGNESPRTMIFNQGITGWGARLAVADSCTDANEGYFYDDALSSLPPVENSSPWSSVSPDWAQRKIVEYYNMYSSDTTIGCGGSSGCSSTCPDHGTHVSGTICGNCNLDGEGIATQTDAANSDGDNDGVAPGAWLIAQDMDPNLGYLNYDGGDLGELVSVAYDETCNGGDCGIDGHNNSWGGSSDEYDTDSRASDRATFKTRQEVAVLVANGNAGEPGCTYYSNCTSDGYDTIGNPATAKNVIGVGSGDPCTANDMAESSSRGDTADGRLKPDIVATGESVSSTRNDGDGSTNSNGGCSILTISGTSMATPTATGLVGLIDQYLNDGFYPSGVATPADGIDPSGMLFKAMLVNSGRRMTGTEASRDGTDWPNMDQGYGFAVLDDVMYFAGDSRNLYLVDEASGVDASGPSSMTYRRKITSSGEPLKVTLVWNDDGANTSCNPCLINDLDLSVVDESSSATYTVTRITTTSNHQVPRTVVPSSPSNGQTTTDNGPDMANNVEQIIVYNPPVGAVFAVTVAASTTPDGPIPFALVITGDTELPCTAPDPVTDLSVAVSGLNRIDLGWMPVNSPASTASANVYRATSAAGPFTLIASGVTAGVYSDDGVSAGTEYFYRVTGLAGDSCESSQSNTASAVATGDCLLGPEFAGLTSADPMLTSNCGFGLTWAEATAGCSGASVAYNIYREEAATAPVDPDDANLIGRELVCGVGGACVCTGGTCTFDDYSAVADGGTYHYLVRAIDSVSNADDGNTTELSATAAGPLAADQLVWSEDFQSCSGDCGFGGYDFGGSGTDSWKGVDATCLSGSGQEYRFGGGSSCTDDYAIYNWYGRFVELTIPANAQNTNVTFSHDYEFESGWDGGVLTLDTDNGSGFGGLVYVEDFDQGGYVGTADQCWDLDSWNGGSWGSHSSVTADLDGACASDAGTSGCGDLDVRIGWAACTDYSINRNGWRFDDIEVRADLPGSCVTVPESVDWLTATTRLQCVGGTNDGAACTGAADCPSGSCSVANKMEWWPGSSGNVLVMGEAPPSWQDTPTYGAHACLGTGPAATYGFCTDAPGADRNYTAFANTQSDFLGNWSLPPLAVGAPDTTTLDSQVSWVYSTEASSVAPVLLFGSSPGIYTVSNDRGFHSATRGVSGGDWPDSGALHWRPSGMNGPAQQRPRVVDFTTAVPPGSLSYTDRDGSAASTQVATFIAGTDGAAYVFDAMTGDAVWRNDLAPWGVDMLLSSPVVGVAGWGNVSSTIERVFVATRDGGEDNGIFGLAMSDGAVSDDWRYDNLSYGGNHTADGGIGIVTGMAMDVFASPPRLYVTTRRRATGGSQDTLWAFDIYSTAPHIQRAWSVEAGDCDGGLSLIGWDSVKKIVVGNNSGEIRTYEADNPAQTASRDYSASAVKGWVMQDFSNDRLVFAAGNTVYSIAETDLGNSTVPLTAVVTSASIPLPYDGRLYVGGVEEVQVLDSQTLTPVAGSPVSLPDAGTVGMPTGDWNADVFYVGTTSGRVYAVEFF